MVIDFDRSQVPLLPHGFMRYTNLFLISISKIVVQENGEWI